MARDEVFDNTAARGGDFQFNEEVASVFDDMLVRRRKSRSVSQHPVPW